jgi:outer membrane protein, heavy metal efflux system
VRRALAWMVALAALLLAPRARAEAPLTLAEVLRSADDRYPLVIAALADLDAARGKLRAAEGGFDPSLKASGTLAGGGYPGQRVDVVVDQPTPLWGASVFAGYRLGLGTVPDYDGKLLTNQYGEVRGGLRVPLLRNGPIDKRRADIRRAEIDRSIASLDVAKQRIEVAKLAAERYWSWVAAGQRAAIARSWLALATSRDGDLQERVARGDIPALELAENQRAVLKRRAELASADRKLAQATNELSLFLRDASGAPVTPPASRLPPELPEPEPFDASRAREDERAAPSRRPDVARIEAQRAKARIDVDLAKNQRLPAVDLLGVASKDLGPGDASRGKPVFEATILLEVPIPGRAPFGRTDAAVAARSKLDALSQLARERVVIGVRNAAVAVSTAAQRARIAAQELDIARKLAEAELERQKLGTSSVLIVNLREQASREAMVRHVDALADYHKAVAAYRAAIGLAREPTRP